MYTVDQRMMNLDRERHQLTIGEFEDLAKDHPRHGLSVVESRSMLKACERDPRDHRKIDQVDTIGFDVERLQPLVSLASDAALPIKFEDIRLHFKITERESVVVIEKRLSYMDPVKLNDLLIKDPQAKFAYVICGLGGIEKPGERIRQALVLAKTIKTRYIEIGRQVEKRIFVVFKELESGFPFPTFNVDLTMHRLPIQRTHGRHRCRKSFDQAAAEDTQIEDADDCY